MAEPAQAGGAVSGHLIDTVRPTDRATTRAFVLCCASVVYETENLR